MLVNMPSLENKPPEKSVREVEVQTEIEGVNFSFLYMNQNTVVVQPQPFSYFMPPMQLGEACYWPSCLPSFVPEQMKLPNGMNPFG